MARLNIYLPDDLAGRARKAELNISALARSAVEDELARRATNTWLAKVRALPRANITHDQAMAALDAAREEYDPR